MATAATALFLLGMRVMVVATTAPTVSSLALVTVDILSRRVATMTLIPAATAASAISIAAIAVAIVAAVAIAFAFATAATAAADLGPLRGTARLVLVGLDQRLALIVVAAAALAFLPCTAARPVLVGLDQRLDLDVALHHGLVRDRSQVICREQKREGGA